MRRKLRKVLYSRVITILVRLQLVQYNKDYDKTEDHLKALQSIGQIIGEVLKRLDDEKCIITG